MTLKKLFSVAMALLVICVMTATVFAASKSDSAELPKGVVPLTWQPTPQNLALKTPEARKLYYQIKKANRYPSMKELKNSPVVAQLDALSNYYLTIYGNTADINTPERQELRDKYGLGILRF